MILLSCLPLNEYKQALGSHDENLAGSHPGKLNTESMRGSIDTDSLAVLHTKPQAVKTSI